MVCGSPMYQHLLYRAKQIHTSVQFSQHAYRYVTRVKMAKSFTFSMRGEWSIFMLILDKGHTIINSTVVYICFAIITCMSSLHNFTASLHKKKRRASNRGTVVFTSPQKLGLQFGPSTFPSAQICRSFYIYGANHSSF